MTVNYIKTLATSSRTHVALFFDQIEIIHFSTFFGRGGWKTLSKPKVTNISEVQKNKVF